MAKAVPPRTQVVVAAFDLDGTLTNGGSVFDWLRAICGTKRTYEATLRLGPALAMAALKGGKAADMTKEDLFSELLRGRDLEEVQAISKRYAAKHVATALRTDTKARLDYHVAAGHHTVIVSASPELYVNEVAGLLGVHGSVVRRGLIVVARIERRHGGCDRRPHVVDGVSALRVPSCDLVKIRA